MSYDIYIGEREFNFTYNLSEFFHDFVKVVGRDSTATGLRALYGMCAEDVETILEQALKDIGEAFSTGDPVDLEAKRSQYNPANGWGSVEAAIFLLHDMAKACREYPYTRVKVH